jgi:hypothetical protein
MEIAATFNPVTYIMEVLRSLVLLDLDWAGNRQGVRGRGRIRRSDDPAERSLDPPVRLRRRPASIEAHRTRR